METLKLVTRPLVLVLLWMAVSAYTISELSTVDRALTAPHVTASAVTTPRYQHRAIARAGSR